jgi:NADPH:quinone reductase-like Zn-dependent oxidoreductase
MAYLALVWDVTCQPSEELLGIGGKVTPVIDKTYPLSETPEAIRYLAAGRACGKVVISVQD